MQPYPVSSATVKAWNLWFLKVLQGGFDVRDLIQEFDAILPKQEIEALYSCILYKPISFRKKAICILSLFKGIPKKYISEYLCVDRATLESFIERYKSGGLKRLLNHKLIKKHKKYELPSYINEVFSILHSPPSCHGFNRTTWKLNDMQKVMAKKKLPIVKLAPLPTCAQFLNVIESVFSGMARAIIHDSDYQSVEKCKSAIDRYYLERNEYFQKHPKRAGNKIWGKERVKATFNESNNCKDPTFR